MPLTLNKDLKAMNFKEMVADYIYDTTLTKSARLPGIVEKAIEEGFSSESLFILAGMQESDSYEKLELYLFTRKEAAKVFLSYYLNKTVAEKYLSIEDSKFVEELMVTYFFNDDFDQVYNKKAWIGSLDVDPIFTYSSILLALSGDFEIKEAFKNILKWQRKF